jgi:hypothetical protein
LTPSRAMTSGDGPADGRPRNHGPRPEVHRRRRRHDQRAHVAIGLGVPGEIDPSG